MHFHIRNVQLSMGLYSHTMRDLQLETLTQRQAVNMHAFNYTVCAIAGVSFAVFKPHLLACPSVHWAVVAVCGLLSTFVQNPSI
jgi:hypothetical protein